MSEEILGVFPGWIPTEKGLLTMKGYHCQLVFTTDRLIVAKEKRHLGALVAAERPYYMFTLASTRDRLKMQEVSAESILKENAENFEIPYLDITVIELAAAHFSGVVWLYLFAGDLDAAKYKIIIKVNYKKYISVIKDFVRAVLPDKV